MAVLSKEIQDYLNKSEHQELIKALIRVITETDENIQIALKWRAITFTKNDNWHHWICNITDTKKSVNIFFHKGSILKDPKKKLSGKGKALRKIEIHTSEDIDKKYLQGLLKDAIIKQLKMPPGINMK